MNLVKSFSTSIQDRGRSFVFGLTLPATALRLILLRPQLLFWSALPIALTLGLYIYGLGTAMDAVRETLTYYLSQMGLAADSWLRVLASGLAQVLLFLIGAFTFSIVATIVASPLNDFLAEATERWVTPTLPPGSPPGFWNKVRLIRIDIAKTLAATGMTLMSLLVSWIPLLNLVAFGCAFLLICFQYISYPQTRRGEGVADGLRFLLKHLFACLGFGAALGFLFAIPFVACFAVPLAVVGGTLLYARAQAPEPFHLR